MEIRPINATETHAVRHPVLRQGKPRDSCIFAGDTLETTLHLGCFDKGQLVGVVTFMVNGHPHYNWENAVQLRGMAVLETYQGKGVGKKLVSYGESEILKKNKDLIWMNAREIAVPFYQSLGYSSIGNVFDIAKVGPHYVMYKKLT